jgi:hypothetical protein
MRIGIFTWLVLAVFTQAGGLEFTETLKEVDAGADATLVTTEFSFTNKGDKPASITKSDSGCSCLKIEISGGKLKYAPGESGVVRTTFEMGNFSGTVDKMVALWIDDDPVDNPSTRLTVRVHIPVLVELEPKTLKWDLGTKADPQIIRIQMAEGKSIRVTGVTSSSESFACELKTVEKGGKYDLIVTPRNIDTPGMTVIRVETDCAISKHRVQQAFAVVRKPSPPQTPVKP